jgi:hypothetical protein
VQPWQKWTALRRCSSSSSRDDGRAPNNTHISVAAAAASSSSSSSSAGHGKLETLTIEWQLSHHVWYMTTTITSNQPRDGPTNNFVSVFFCLLTSPWKRR